jgi:hypothetical protein
MLRPPMPASETENTTAPMVSDAATVSFDTAVPTAVRAAVTISATA